MGKIAFLFSGQGAQKTGMGKTFYEALPIVRELFDGAEKLRPGTLEQCFSGDAETLRRTENAQPCLYLADAAAGIALRETGLHPDVLAGFSLGELAALAFGGAFPYLEGFRIVCTRARLMQEAGEQRAAAMFAVLRLPAEKVEALCAQIGGVWPVNFNCPGQTVVSCVQEQQAAFVSAVSGAGGKAMRVPVSGGFHSPLMDSAAKGFAAFLEKQSLRVPGLPVYANRTAEPYEMPQAETLASQVNHPVRWEETIRRMAADGVCTFVEAGVGNTLQKLVSRILPGVSAYAVETMKQAAEVSETIMRREKESTTCF